MNIILLDFKGIFYSSNYTALNIYKHTKKKPCPIGTTTQKYEKTQTRVSFGKDGAKRPKHSLSSNLDIRRAETI